LPFEGVATEVWNIKVRLDSSTDNIDDEGGEGVQNADGSITRRFITWERENWAFDVSTGSRLVCKVGGRDAQTCAGPLCLLYSQNSLLSNGLSWNSGCYQKHNHPHCFE
jgi:hypothetical protein